MPSHPLSNYGRQPRPIVGIRTSSLRDSSSRPDFTLTTPKNPARPTIIAPVPAPSRGRLTTTRHRSLTVQHAPPLVATNDLHASNIQRSNTSLETSSKFSKRSSSCSGTMRYPMRPAKVKRWAGLTRTTSDWDGLRKDPELWFDEGDCYIHLYARGQSQRGPSFRVPFDALRKANCGAMFSLCYAQISPSPGSDSQGAQQLSSGILTVLSKTNTVELYIPAPDHTSREGAFQWHITTRNFLAFTLGKPLVGSHFGQALVDLQERLRLFRSGQIDNHNDFLAYIDDQGYRDLVDCPDYALATLYYAEHYKLRDIWIDAFAHCVGMNDALVVSPEFEPISRLTKALITRAYLEMDIHLGRVTCALRNFLEEDLSSAFLGLTDGARAHLDRFRSFLHSYYVEKFGYWPPPKGSSFSKALCKSMYFDFKNMHDYLVDLESTADIATQRPASGGICVLQNVDLFDRRHNFIPLPHPLPILPNHESLTRKTHSQKTLRAFALGSKQSKTERYTTARAALTEATNNGDPSLINSPIIQTYMRFERQCALNNQREERVSMADARKVRWLLIYGTLQYLISAIQSPKEVRDTDAPDYFLCCLVAEKSPWQSTARTPHIPAPSSMISVPEAINKYLSESYDDITSGDASTLTIQPDCQTDGYFTHTNPDVTPVTSRPISVEMPAPLRIPTSIVRHSSIRSLRRMSLPGISSRRNSVKGGKAPTQPFCEIIVHGFGNGLNGVTVEAPSWNVSSPQSTNPSGRSSRSNLPDGAGPETSWLRPSTPESASRRSSKLGSFVRSQIRPSMLGASEQSELPDSSESADIPDSPFWSDGSSASSKSSTNSEGEVRTERECSSAEASGLLGGLVSVEVPPVATSNVTSQSSVVSPDTPPEGDFHFSFDQQFEASALLPFEVSPAPLSPDSTIGVALAGPPVQSSPATGTFLKALPRATLTIRPSLTKSLSTDSIIALSPLQMNPPSPQFCVPSKNELSVDLFAALSLAPHQFEVQVENLVRRNSSETTCSIDDAIPPPILKNPPINMLQVSENPQRLRKKEGRGGFWRR